ncbi:MAG: Tat pathway signal sequence domain protein [Alphaproteobacteria bacterium]|nr:Tat pathway signal sequence domain protein [Alphaproteobacteria bacterium]
MRRMCSLLTALAIFAAAGLAQAQTAPGIGLELNRIEDAGQSCRIYLVLDNATDANFSSFLVDLVVFDAEGVIQRRIAFENAPLPAHRTRVKQFDLERLTCAQAARIHFNDVAECRDQSGKRDCAALVWLSNLTRAKFTQ